MDADDETEGVRLCPSVISVIASGEGRKGRTRDAEEGGSEDAAAGVGNVSSGSCAGACVARVAEIDTEGVEMAAGTVEVEGPAPHERMWERSSEQSPNCCPHLSHCSARGTFSEMVAVDALPVLGRCVSGWSSSDPLTEDEESSGLTQSKSDASSESSSLKIRVTGAGNEAGLWRVVEVA